MAKQGKVSVTPSLAQQVPEPADWAIYGDDLFWLFDRLRVILLNKGEELRGFSFSQKDDGWLLCIRFTDQSIPVVAYSKKLYPTGCVSNLRRRYEDGTLQLFHDRYA